MSVLFAWPWPLTPVPAGLVGAGLVTTPVALLRIALRERDAARALPAAATGGAVLAITANRSAAGAVQEPYGPAP